MDFKNFLHQMNSHFNPISVRFLKPLTRAAMFTGQKALRVWRNQERPPLGKEDAWEFRKERASQANGSQSASPKHLHVCHLETDKTQIVSPTPDTPTSAYRVEPRKWC